MTDKRVYYADGGKVFSQDDVEEMLDFTVRNATGKSRDFARSLMRYYEENEGFLTERQTTCLAEMYERMTGER